ncbi:hypothetical protein HYC85_025405 [Camellia sinensis]|uniref:Non-reducing end beta-L-arabinofuranosidase-like GH127 catalytic domain-containing protein n=1 Tax=Camellia sinensis TaxID=4442 RepID=A0A7J7GAX7_CAMSI|nr:hypothetical protein HYC85_025405 [Camellia sinensis]
MAGLLDQYILAENAQALKMLARMVDYFYNRVLNVITKYSVEKHYLSLNEETGGMNDVLYKLYAVMRERESERRREETEETEAKERERETQRGDYLGRRLERLKPRLRRLDHWSSIDVGGLRSTSEVCDRRRRAASERQSFDQLQRLRLRERASTERERADDISGFHANTHIPVVIGSQMRYEVTGDSLYKEIGTFFVDIVNSSHSYATGGTLTRNAKGLVTSAIAVGLGALTHTLGTLVLAIGASGFATAAAATAIGIVVGSFR